MSDGWHFKKELHASHILTTAGIVISAIWFGATIDKRVAVIETQMEDVRAITAANSQTVANLIKALSENTKATAVNTEKLNGLSRRMDRDRRHRQ